MSDKNILSVRPVIPGHLLYLERPRIDELLGKALRSPVVLVLGGAGYGKTHAVHSHLSKNQIVTVWIQFSERDNNGGRFWENYTQSISMLSKGTAAKLAKQGFPATDQQFERYLSIPLEANDPRVKNVFVYDDLHLIHDKTVLRFLEHSITSPFPNITSILISRKELPFNLMNLFSKGLLAEINEGDLRFTSEEMEAYFSMQGINAPVEILDSVYRDTEGWAFAIHLAGLYLKSVSSGEGYRTQVLHSNIYQLIESEVMAQMDPELRKFLIKLTLVDESAPELIRELARLHQRKSVPDKDAEKKVECLIRRIEEIGSFIRFDAYRNAFSIHRLFRDYLSGLQGEINEKEKKEVYLATADWCAANNLKMDAIMYYAKVGEYGKFVAQIHTLPLVLPRKTVSLLLDLLEQIPEDVHLKYAETYLICARFLLSSGKLNEAKAKIEDIVKNCEARPESKEKNYILFNCYYSLGLINKLLAPLSQDYSFPWYFEKSNYYQIKWGKEAEGPKTIITLGGYACRVGSKEPADMDRYLAALSVSIPHVAASMRGCMYGLDDLARGELAFFRMDFEKARGSLREALAKARERRQYEVESRSLFYLLRIGLFQGDVDLIDESRKVITALLENQEYVNRYVYYDIYQGWFYAHLGDCGKVSPWLKNETEEIRFNSLAYGLELLVRAKIHLREKNYAAVLLDLKQTGHNLGIFIFGKIEIKILEAVCYYQMHEKEKAYASLDESRVLAEPDGLYAPFAEMGRDMRALASSALKDKPAIPGDFLEKIRNLSSAYAKKFFNVSEYFSVKTSRVSTQRQDNAGLSGKEHDVLIALFQGLTQDEIAASTSRSINTVKSVIKRIYDKLGAVNRADAIRIAMSRGLLEWAEEKTVDISGPESPGKKLLLPGFNSTARTR